MGRNEKPNTEMVRRKMSVQQVYTKARALWEEAGKKSFEGSVSAEITNIRNLLEESKFTEKVNAVLVGIRMKKIKVLPDNEYAEHEDCLGVISETMEDHFNGVSRFDVFAALGKNDFDAQEMVRRGCDAQVNKRWQHLEEALSGKADALPVNGDDLYKMLDVIPVYAVAPQQYELLQRGFWELYKSISDKLDDVTHYNSRQSAFTAAAKAHEISVLIGQLFLGYKAHESDVPHPEMQRYQTVLSALGRGSAMKALQPLLSRNNKKIAA